MRQISSKRRACTNLMEEETSKSSGNDRVTDHKVPIGPLPLDPVERGKVSASIELLCRIFVEDGGGGEGRIEGHGEGGGGGEAGGSCNNSRSCSVTYLEKSDHFIFPTTATYLDPTEHPTFSCSQTLLRA